MYAKFGMCEMCSIYNSRSIQLGISLYGICCESQLFCCDVLSRINFDSQTRLEMSISRVFSIESKQKTAAKCLVTV